MEKILIKLANEYGLEKDVFLKAAETGCKVLFNQKLNELVKIIGDNSEELEAMLLLCINTGLVDKVGSMNEKEKGTSNSLII